MVYVILQGSYSDIEPIGYVETKEEAERVSNALNAKETYLGEYWWDEIKPMYEVPEKETVMGRVLNFVCGEQKGSGTRRSMYTSDKWIIGNARDYTVWIPIDDDKRALKVGYDLFYAFILKEREGPVEDVMGYRVVRSYTELRSLRGT